MTLSINENLPTGGVISRSGNDVLHVPAVIWNLTPTQRRRTIRRQRKHAASRNYNTRLTKNFY